MAQYWGPHYGFGRSNSGGINILKWPLFYSLRVGITLGKPPGFSKGFLKGVFKWAQKAVVLFLSKKRGAIGFPAHLSFSFSRQVLPTQLYWKPFPRREDLLNPPLSVRKIPPSGLIHHRGRRFYFWRTRRLTQAQRRVLLNRGRKKAFLGGSEYLKQ